MRVILTILIFNAVFAFGQRGSCYSQVDTLTNLEVFQFIDKMPTVKGGMTELYKEMSSRIKNSPGDKVPVDSKVIIAFIINEKGEVIGKRIIKNIEGTDLAEQLLDVVEDFKWEPGSCNGKTVATLQLLPVIIDFNKD